MTFEIRDEVDTDAAAIYDVTERAFRDMPYAGGDEQDIVDRLRAAGGLSVSLVVVIDGEIVGHAAFSPAKSSDGSGPWFTLGPVSVSPGHQRKGIGSKLIESGLARIEAMGAQGCVLTGNPDYYRRFGFAVSPSNSPGKDYEDFFMIKQFAGEPPAGALAFHEAFYGQENGQGISGRRRNRLLLGTLILVFALFGFNQLSLNKQGRIVEFITLGDWPLEWAVRKQFARKQPELREIIEFANDAPARAGLRVGLLGSPPNIKKYADGQPNIAQALASIEALFMFVDDDEAAVHVVLGSEVRSAVNFDLSYFYPLTDDDLLDCDDVDVRDRPRIGTCWIELDSNWYARYQWHPVDAEEFKRLLDEQASGTSAQ